MILTTQGINAEGRARDREHADHQDDDGEADLDEREALGAAPFGVIGLMQFLPACWMSRPPDLALPASHTSTEGFASLESNLEFYESGPGARLMGGHEGRMCP